MSVCAVLNRIGENLPFRGMLVKIPNRDNREQGDGHMDSHRCAFGFGKKATTFIN